MYRVNSSNQGKLKQYREFLGEIEVSEKDLKEPLSDPLTIIQYKASQFQNTLVDDTSLEIEGESIGINIRWFLEKLPTLLGKKAHFRCLIGIHRNEAVEIFQGECHGHIAPAEGNSFGFNNYFVPLGEKQSFGVKIAPELNPRIIALKKFKEGSSYKVLAPLFEWTGAFQ